MPDNPWLGKAGDDVGSGARDRLAEPHTDPSGMDDSPVTLALLLQPQFFCLYWKKERLRAGSRMHLTHGLPNMRGRWSSERQFFEKEC